MSKEIEAQNHVVFRRKLGEIVLSVARTAAQSQKIAEHVSLIDKTAIQKEAPTTAADLPYGSWGSIQKSQGGGGSPILRGFEANRVLLVVDGVRMNNAIYCLDTHKMQSPLTLTVLNGLRLSMVPLLWAMVLMH